LSTAAAKFTIYFSADRLISRSALLRPRQAAAVLWGKAGRLARAGHVPLCTSGGGAARRGDPIRAGVRFVWGRACVFAASDRQRSGWGCTVAGVRLAIVVRSAALVRVLAGGGG